MRKLPLVILALLLSLTFVLAITEFERYDGPSNNDAGLFGANWNAQSFTIGDTSFNIRQNVTLIALNIRKELITSNTNILHVSIRAVNSSGSPTGSDLTGGSVNATDFGTDDNEWHNITMNRSYSLEQTTQYAIVLRAPQATSPSHRVFPRLNNTSPTYTGGNLFSSPNSGSTWVRLIGEDLVFQLWGGKANQSTINITLVRPTNGTNVIVPLNFNGTVTPNPVGTLNLSNATLFVWYNNGTFFNDSFITFTGSNLNYSIFNLSSIPLGIFQWNIQGCAQDEINGTVCDMAAVNFSFESSAFQISNRRFNSTVYETASEIFQLNFSALSQFTSFKTFLTYKGTRRLATTSCNASNFCTALNTFDIPTGAGNNSFLWEIELTNSSGTTPFNSTGSNQTVLHANLTLCGLAGGNTAFINFTFKNETVLKQSVNAFVSDSSWTYYLGTGSVQKNLTFSDATERASFSFCFVPAHRTVNLNLTLSYDNSESEQRVFNPAIFAQTRNTLNQTLFLLPSNDGIFVTFQVINIAQQPIPDALVTITRSGFGTISQTRTGGSGTTNVFLNPNFAYTLTVSATGFPTFSTTQAFPTTEFTVTLGGSAVVGTDLGRGITVDINPKVGTLLNNTNVQFNMSLNSSFNVLDSWGFVLSNSSGTVLTSNTSTSTTGGTLFNTLNTGNHSLITMDYFWEINSTFNNRSVSWAVRAQPEGGFQSFFDRLKTYTDDGIFGLNNFSLALILFSMVFIFGGILSFKFGLTSPMAIFSVVTIFVILLDTFELLPTFGGVRFVPGVVMVLILIIMALGGQRS